MSEQNLDINKLIDFDDQVDTSKPTLDPSKVDWRQKSRTHCIAEIGEISLSESVEQKVVESDSIDEATGVSYQIYGTDSRTD